MISALYVAAAGMLYAVYIVFNKAVMSGVDPITFAWGSSLFAAIFGFIYLISHGKKIKPVVKNIKKIIVLGAVMGIVYPIGLFVGQSMITASSAGFLLRVSPVFATLFAFLFFREKIRIDRILIMGVMVFGAYILSLTTGFKPEIGALLILAAGVALGFDHAYSRGILKKNVPPDMLAAAHLGISGIFTSLVVIILGKIQLVNVWVYAVSGILVFTAVILRNIGLQNIKSGIASSILLLSPIFSAVLGYYLLGERLIWFQWIGAGIILLGSAILIFATKKSSS